MSKLHGCQDHPKVNQMVWIKHTETFSNDQIEQAKFESFVTYKIAYNNFTHEIFNTWQTLDTFGS